MEDKVIYKYIFDKDYNPSYSNGVYGGANTDGNIIMNFFCERIPLPNEMEFTIENGQPSSTPSKVDPEESKIIRFIQSGVIINANTAKAIYKWLGDQLLEMGVSNDELQHDDSSDTISTSEE